MRTTRSLGVKLALAAVALAFAFAPPAEAAKSRKHKAQVHKGQVAAKQTASKPKARPRTVRAPASNDVYFQGHYLGTDPDPHIRHELARDLGKYFGGDD